MIPGMRVAAVQMSSGEDKSANLQAAADLISQAVGAGARLLVLPELFNCLGRPDRIVAAAESIPGPTSDALSDLARRHKITLVAGSIAQRSPHADKVFNTSLLFDDAGKIVAQYRKRHLFDLEIPGQVSSCESSWLLAGDDLCVTETVCGRIAQAICYDLRFPEMFRQLSAARCEICCIPAAFTAVTGRDHWEVLLRARAIENQAYVIAANQFGPHRGGVTNYGHSMIVDPWGNVLAIAADGAGLALADIDRQRLATVRAQLPALAHRRDI